MNYTEFIQNFHPLTIEDILQISLKFVPDAYKNAPWTIPGLAHGTACLSNNDQLSCYLAAYGEMHRAKLQKILNDFPFKRIDSPFEVIDWGCGQGIASVCLIDELRKKRIIENLRKVTLIEPSEVALKRAKCNVLGAVGDDDVNIESLNYFLPSIKENIQSIGELHVEEPICFHLFSNILDIASIDLKELAFLVSSSGYRHYFLCVGPNNFGNTRIDAFFNYFQHDGKDDVFSDYKAGQYAQLPNGKWFSCITKGFQIVREEGEPHLVSLSYYPAKQFFAAFQLDAIKQFDNPTYDKAYWNLKSAFEVLAPFDIGASIYEDIDPILAVLNNIVTRGLPTKCSPLIEAAINNEFHFSMQTERYGTVSYTIADKGILAKNEELLHDIPIGIARIEKVVIEALLTGHISLNDKEWSVLVKENDVPCSALAFADLQEMFNHLSALSRNYDQRTFPKIKLQILSPLYSNSSLHLGNKVFMNMNLVNKEEYFDMVIDIAINEDIDAVNVQFSEFNAKKNCYFNIRSSKGIYCKREIYTTDPIVYKSVTKLNSNGNNLVIEENAKHLIYFLHLLFRKQGFRPGQLPILNRALQGKGVIGLLPTGGGKSLTYQLAALLQPGVTVIIDPLKSLMEDQYDGLLSTGIDCCTYINSELGKDEKTANENKMEQSQVVFTFMSPERLCIYEFRERLQNMHNLNVYFSYGVIDEVHCVSEWGQDFRFSYLHLGRNLYNYVLGKNKPISLFGLTATASFDVLSDVERELTGNGAFSLDPDATVRFENSNRLELQYKVEKIEVEYNKDPQFDPQGLLSNYPSAVSIGSTKAAYSKKSNFLNKYIKIIPKYLRELQTKEAISTIIERFNVRENLENIDGDCLRTEMPDDYYYEKEYYQQAGIVFCPHVKSTGISVNVNYDNLKGTCEVGTFAGSSDGLDLSNTSMQNMRKFRDNQQPIMVATKAFGMGIDKPNVRYTINMNYSSSLESFVQESGRAGRDRKMALSVILMSDYHLKRINKTCSLNTFPLCIIKGKWFKEEELNTILSAFNLHIDEQYIDDCSPVQDIVRLKCNTDNYVTDDKGDKKQLTWKCDQSCSKYSICQLKHTDRVYRSWMYYKDLIEYLQLNHIRVEKEYIDYQNPDYKCVMYFFNNNFKGEFIEKEKMHELMSLKEIQYFIGNDKKDKSNEHIVAQGFLDAVLKAKFNTEIVSLISYEEDSYADIEKAIYRMCVIGLVDDFTQDYGARTFRILSTRKKDGSYYEHLKEFLMRYYSEERAENEIEKASARKGQNEIHKCLGYLTEFIYEKVASKRKKAIDEMRRFCLIGIDDSKDWKEINEDLKDEIYYYFNSKYAREGYKTDNNEPFSLLDDTDRAKTSSYDIVLKYIRVIDIDVIGASGSPKDNIKHLHGAVRLIRRSETDTNAALCFLNVFCLLALKVGSNQNMMEDLKKSYIEGYTTFRDNTKDKKAFYHFISDFKESINQKGRNVASKSDLQMLHQLEMTAELAVHNQWINLFSTMYNNKE